jgi:hypothetical protein
MRWTKLDLTCIYFLKNKLTHHCFKSLPSICTSWIGHMDFLHFLPSKIRVNPTSVISSLYSPQCWFFFGRLRHAVVLCHTSFSLSQDELTASALSSDNALSCRLPSWAKTETLNPHHRRMLPSLNRSNPTLHCYKNSSQPWSLSPPLNHISILPLP